MELGLVSQEQRGLRVVEFVSEDTCRLLRGWSQVLTACPVGTKLDHRKLHLNIREHISV